MIARLLRAVIARIQRAWLLVFALWRQLTGPGIELKDIRSTLIATSALVRGTDGGLVSMGAGTSVGRGAEIYGAGATISIGRNVYVGPYVTVVGKAGIHIGDGTQIAERVTIRDQDHRIHGCQGVFIRDAGMVSAPIRIAEDVWIGAGAVVLKGVTIGRGAVVAANAVVNRDVESFEIVGGVPAKHLGYRRD